MAESGQILQTTTADLNRVAQLVAGNTVSNMRLEQTRLNLRILKNQKRLNELRAHENLVKARIYNNIEQAQIQVAGQNTQVAPLSSYRPSDIAPTPNQGIATAKFRAYSSIYGVSQLDSAINDINNQIMTLQAQIRKDKNSYTELQEAINTATQNQPTSFKNTSIGRAILPAPSDLQKDKLTKSRTYDVILLQQLSLLFLNYSSSTTLDTLTANTPSPRGFPDEAKLPKTMIIFRAKFWSVGQRFQDNTGAPTDMNFVQGPDMLNFDDPGSTQNQVVLNKWVDILRDVGENTKITESVQDFISRTIAIASDSAVSKGTERTPDPTLSASNSLNQQTQSYPATAMFFGGLYLGSFDPGISTVTEMVKKWWGKQQEQYIPLPRCPDIKITPSTPTELKEVNAEALDQSLISAGQQSFYSAFQKVKALQVKENSATPLPAGAPDWAVQFNNLYGRTAKTGQILYPIVAPGTTGYIPQISATVTVAPASNPNYGLYLASTPGNYDNTRQTVAPSYLLDSYAYGPTPSLTIYQLWSDTTVSSTGAVITVQ